MLCQRKRAGDYCAFFELLDIARLNAHIVFNVTRLESAAQNRSNFLKLWL